MPPSTSNSNPVALTMTSAAISSPDVSRTPDGVNRFDLAGHDRGAAGPHRLEQVAVRHEAHALIPR